MSDHAIEWIDNVLYIDRVRTAFSVREWSPGWWMALNGDARFSAPAQRTTTKDGSLTIGSRVRRWRTRERARAIALRVALLAHDVTKNQETRK